MQNEEKACMMQKGGIDMFQVQRSRQFTIQGQILFSKLHFDDVVQDNSL